MPLMIQEVTLRVLYNSECAANPATWDWHDLLDQIQTSPACNIVVVGKSLPTDRDPVRDRIREHDSILPPEEEEDYLERRNPNGKYRGPGCLRNPMGEAPVRFDDDDYFDDFAEEDE